MQVIHRPDVHFWGSSGHGLVVGCQPSTHHSGGHFCFGDLARQWWAAAARVGVQIGTRQACISGRTQRDMQPFVPGRRWLPLISFCRGSVQSHQERRCAGLRVPLSNAWRLADLGIGVVAVGASAALCQLLSGSAVQVALTLFYDRLML